MNALGNKTPRIVKIEESYGINLAFEAKADIPHTALVKLDPATGEIEKVSAVADEVIGYAVTGGKAGEEVTICTQFSAVVYGVASGAIAVGDKLQASGVGTTQTTYIKQAATGTTVALALEDAADGEQVLVGVFRVFRHSTI